MDKENIIKEAIDWYKGKKSLYDQLADKINILLKDIIKEGDVLVYEVCSRGKEIDSFSEKIKDEKYDDPIRQITDLAGARIIAYVESDLTKICEIIEANFQIDKNNSSDKRELLGIDKVGYRSIHYVCTFPNQRVELAEFKKYKSIKFEIQVRTLLQHTWAEVEHDRNYKFSGVLPTHLQRRFKVLAGVLELADRELDEIALSIEKYKDKVNSNVKEGNFKNIIIDSTSLKTYLDEKYSDILQENMFPNLNGQEGKIIMDELNTFGVVDLFDLEGIISPDYMDIYKNNYNSEKTTYHGMLRDFMIINNAEKYFTNCWNHNWTSLDSDDIQFFNSFDAKIEDIIKSSNINIHDNDTEDIGFDTEV